MEKKQIIFIEPRPNVAVYRVARSLKESGKYETVLICFSNVNKEFYEKAYDKIIIFNMSHKIDRYFFKTLISSFKKMFGKEGVSFFKKIKKMRPYLFQVTGPDLFILITMFFLRKSPKIYYSNDIWGVDKRNFFFTKEFWIKGEFQKFCEKICFKKADGIINKKSLEELDALKYSLNVPKMALSPSLLDQWTFKPKKKNNKEIHIVYGASPNDVSKEQVPFIELINLITSQKIHFHTYGHCIEEKRNKFFTKQAKKNKYFHFHGRVDPRKLNEEMSKKDYAIFHYFYPGKANINPGLVKPLLAAKMINYIEAGIPIIISKDFEYMVKVIKKHNLGVTIEFDELKNLGKNLEKIKYKKLQEDIKKYQENFRLSKKIKEIEDFYEKVIRLKK